MTKPNHNPEPGRVLTIKELSDLLKIPVSSLYFLTNAGKIPAVKVGKHWRYLEKDIMSLWPAKAGFTPNLNRIVAVFTLIAFLWNNTLTAGTVMPPVTGIVAPAQTGDFRNFSIPEELGTIQEIFIPPADAARSGAEAKPPFIIYIQDAHAVRDAQHNIRRIIQHLQTQYGIRLVAMEGITGELDPTLFRAFPDVFVREQVLDEYLGRGEINGPELAAVLNPREAVYAGLEDWKLYEANFRAYLEIIQVKDKAVEQLTGALKAAEEEARTFLSPELFDFHTKSEAFWSEELGFLEFLKYLKSLTGAIPEAERFPELSRLLASLDAEERFDGKSLDQELQALTEQIRANRQIDKLLLMQINEKHQSYQGGLLNAAGFASFLAGTALELGMDLQMSPAMKELLTHSQTLAAIKGTHLFSELKTFLLETESKSVRSELEKSLMEKFRRLRLLNQMIKMELVREDWTAYETAPADYERLLENPAVLEPAKRFYRIVRARDFRFRDNLKQLMEKHHVDSAVVLTGGFHHEGFAENLKKMGAAYAVVTPRILSLKGQEVYHDIMQGKLSYAGLLQGSFYDAFARHAAANLTAQWRGHELARNLKNWRDEIIRTLAGQGRIAEAGNYTRYVDSLYERLEDRSDSEATEGVDSKAAVESLEKEISGHREKAAGKLWNDFQFRFQKLTASLKKLAGEDKLTQENVGNLLAEKSATFDMPHLALAHADLPDYRRMIQSRGDIEAILNLPVTDLEGYLQSLDDLEEGFVPPAPPDVNAGVMSVASAMIKLATAVDSGELRKASSDTVAVGLQPVIGRLAGQIGTTDKQVIERALSGRSETEKGKSILPRSEVRSVKAFIQYPNQPVRTENPARPQDNIAFYQLPLRNLKEADRQELDLFFQSRFSGGDYVLLAKENRRAVGFAKFRVMKKSEFENQFRNDADMLAAYHELPAGPEDVEVIEFLPVPMPFGGSSVDQLDLAKVIHGMELMPGRTNRVFIPKEIEDSKVGDILLNTLSLEQQVYEIQIFPQGELGEPKEIDSKRVKSVNEFENAIEQWRKDFGKINIVILERDLTGAEREFIDLSTHSFYVLSPESWFPKNSISNPYEILQSPNQELQVALLQRAPDSYILLISRSEVRPELQITAGPGALAPTRSEVRNMEELRDMIDAVVQTAGAYFSTPFSSQAQSGFQAIRDQAAATWAEGNTFRDFGDDLSAHYTIQLANLYGAGDYQSVFEFFEWANQEAGKSANHPMGMFINDFSTIQIYLIAAYLSPQRVSEFSKDTSNRNFFAIQTSKLNRFDGNKMQIPANLPAQLKPFSKYGISALMGAIVSSVLVIFIKFHIKQAEGFQSQGNAEEAQKHLMAAAQITLNLRRIAEKEAKVGTVSTEISSALDAAMGQYKDLIDQAVEEINLAESDPDAPRSEVRSQGPAANEDLPALLRESYDFQPTAEGIINVLAESVDWLERQESFKEYREALAEYGRLLKTNAVPDKGPRGALLSKSRNKQTNELIIEFDQGFLKGLFLALRDIRSKDLFLEILGFTLIREAKGLQLMIQRPEYVQAHEQKIQGVLIDQRIAAVGKRQVELKDPKLRVFIEGNAESIESLVVDTIVIEGYEAKHAHAAARTARDNKFYSPDRALQQLGAAKIDPVIRSEIERIRNHFLQLYNQVDERAVIRNEFENQAVGAVSMFRNAGDQPVPLNRFPFLLYLFLEMYRGNLIPGDLRAWIDNPGQRPADAFSGQINSLYERIQNAFADLSQGGLRSEVRAFESVRILGVEMTLPEGVVSTFENLPELKEGYARVIHITNNPNAVAGIIENGLDYSRQGMLTSTARAYAKESLTGTDPDEVYGAQDSRYKNGAVVVIDVPENEMRIHYVITRAPGILPARNADGTLRAKAVIQLVDGKITGRSEVRHQTLSADNIFLANFTAEEIVKTYLAENRSIERVIEIMAQAAEAKKRDIEKPYEDLLTEVSRALIGKNREQVKNYLDQGGVPAAVKRLSDTLAAVGVPVEFIDSAVLTDAVTAVIQRTLITGDLMQIAAAGEGFGFAEGRALADYAVDNPFALDAIMNEAVLEEGFRTSYNESRLFREYGALPGRVIAVENQKPWGNAVVFGLGLLTGDVEGSRELITEHLNGNDHTAVVHPRRDANRILRELSTGLLGLDRFGYDETHPLTGPKMGGKYNQALWIAGTDLKLETGKDFNGTGLLTEESVLLMSKLRIKSFVRLAELILRSEYLKQYLEISPDGSAPFPMLTPRAMSAIAEFFNQLARTDAARRAMARAA